MCTFLSVILDHLGGRASPLGRLLSVGGVVRVIQGPHCFEQFGCPKALLLCLSFHFDDLLLELGFADVSLELLCLQLLLACKCAKTRDVWISLR